MADPREPEEHYPPVAEVCVLGLSHRTFRKQRTGYLLRNVQLVHCGIWGIPYGTSWKPVVNTIVRLDGENYPGCGAKGWGTFMANVPRQR